jgi:archaellum component FlaC
MTNEQIETMVQLAEDIGYALAAFKALDNGGALSAEVYREAVDRLEQSHSDIAAMLKARNNDK